MVISTLPLTHDLIDCPGGAPTKKDSVKVIKDMCLTYNLIKRFTWRQKNPLI